MNSESEIETLGRLRLFEALSQAESRYQTLVERLREIVFQYNAEWQLVFLNQAWENTLGYSLEASNGQHFLDFLHPEDKLAMAEYLQTEGIIGDEHKEMRLCHQDGHAIWFELSIKPNPDGLGGVGLLHNIDHHKKLESSLREARDLAIEAAQAKFNFVANINHEMRTPLNGILGGFELLEETELDEEQQGYVQMGLQSGNDLLTLVNDALDYSKIESGQLALKYSETDLSALVQNALASATPAQCQLETSCSIGKDVPPVVITDSKRLYQILLNLLSNAFKFTQHGSVRIELSIAEAQTQNGLAEVHFKISDSGIGIAKEQQDAIFHSFTQADSSSTREHGGNGLGLTIVKRLVEAMDGEIELLSEVGRGSQFSVKLPLRLA